MVVVFYFTSTARYIKVFELVMVEVRSTCRTQEYQAEGEMSRVQMFYNALFPTNTLNRISCLYEEFGKGIMNEVCSRKRNQEATITDANH